MPVFGKIVVIRRNGMDGSMFPLIHDKCMFGRSTDCDIRVQLPNVKDHQCILEKTNDGRFQLKNLFEDGATKVNEGSPKSSLVLRHKDVFSIFDRSFRIEYPPGSGIDHVSRKSFGTPVRKTPLKESTNDSRISEKLPKSSDPFESLVMEMKISVKNKPCASKQQPKAIPTKQEKCRESKRRSAIKIDAQPDDENSPPQSKKKVDENLLEEKPKQKIKFKINKPKSRHSLGSVVKKSNANKAKGRASIAKIVTHVTETKDAIEEPQEAAASIENTDKKSLPIFKKTKPTKRHSIGSTAESNTKITKKNLRKSIAEIKYQSEQKQQDADVGDFIETEETTSNVSAAKEVQVFEERKPNQRHSIGSTISVKKNTKGRKSVPAGVKYQAPSGQKEDQKESETEETDTSLVQVILTDVAQETATPSTPQMKEDALTPQKEEPVVGVYEFSEPDSTDVTSLIKSIKKNRRRSSGSTGVGRQRALHSFGSPIVLNTASPLRKSIGELRRQSQPLQEVSFEGDSAADDSIIEVENGTSPCKVTRDQNSIRRKSLRKRVSFGPVLSPEEFVKTMPSNTPVKKGSTPRRSTRNSLFTPGNLPTLEEGDSPAVSSTSSTPKTHVASPKVALDFKSPGEGTFKSPLTPVPKPKKKARTPTPFRLSTSKMKSQSLLHQVLHASLPTFDTTEFNGTGDVGASPTFSRKKSATPKQDSPKTSPASPKLPSKRSATTNSTGKAKSRKTSASPAVKRRSVHKTFANRQNGKRPLWSEVVKKGKKTTKAEVAKKTSQKNIKVASRQQKLQDSPSTPDNVQHHVDSPATVYIGRKRSRVMPVRTPKASRYGLPQKIDEPLNESFTGVADMMKTPKQSTTANVVKKMLSTPTIIRPRSTKKGQVVEEHFGMKRMFKTPRNKNVVEPVEKHFGTKRLLKTPSQPKSDEPNKTDDVAVLRGVQRMTKTPKIKGKPVIEHFGTKRLLQTPKEKKDPVPSNDVGLKAASKLLKTPNEYKKSVDKAAKKSRVPNEPVEKHFGTKRLLQTPKDRSNKPVMDETAKEDIRHLVRTPRNKYPSVEEHFGTKRMFTSPKTRIKSAGIDGDYFIETLYTEEEYVQAINKENSSAQNTKAIEDVMPSTTTKKAERSTRSKATENTKEVKTASVRKTRRNQNVEETESNSDEKIVEVSVRRTRSKPLATKTQVKTKSSQRATRSKKDENKDTTQEIITATVAKSPKLEKIQEETEPEKVAVSVQEDKPTTTRRNTRRNQEREVQEPLVKQTKRMGRQTRRNKAPQVESDTIATVENKPENKAEELKSKQVVSAHSTRRNKIKVEIRQETSNQETSSQTEKPKNDKKSTARISRSKSAQQVVEDVIKKPSKRSTRSRVASSDNEPAEPEQVESVKQPTRKTKGKSTSSDVHASEKLETKTRSTRSRAKKQVETAAVFTKTTKAKRKAEIEYVSDAKTAKIVVDEEIEKVETTRTSSTNTKKVTFDITSSTVSPLKAAAPKRATRSSSRRK